MLQTIEVCPLQEACRYPRFSGFLDFLWEMQSHRLIQTVLDERLHEVFLQWYPKLCPNIPD